MYLNCYADRMKLSITLCFLLALVVITAAQGPGRGRFRGWGPRGGGPREGGPRGGGPRGGDGVPPRGRPGRGPSQWGSRNDNCHNVSTLKTTLINKKR